VVSSVPVHFVMARLLLCDVFLFVVILWQNALDSSNRRVSPQLLSAPNFADGPSPALFLAAPPNFLVS